MMIKQYILFLLMLPLALQAGDFIDEKTPTNALPDNALLATGWVLDFSDEFNDDEVDPAKWNIDTSTKSRAARPKLGIASWMWKSYNVKEEDGNLVLKVTKPNASTMYCGSIQSANKYETMYGYFEARIKIADAAKGTHTAFWLQGPEMWKVDGTANDGAEIDIFESAWLEDYTKAVIHIDGYGADKKANTKQYTTPGIHDGYHTFAMHWTEDFMNIYYDGVLKVSYSEDQWVVRAKEYLWLSDGASFGYEGDNFTSQPFGDLTNAYVDYIRVWKYMGDDDGIISDPNLVKDGDFEDIYSSNWARDNNDIILSESTYPVNNSGYCRMPSIPNSRIMTQSIAVEPGETYQFQFSGRIQNSHAATDINDHSSKGLGTLKAEIYANYNSIMELTTQSNTNTTLTTDVTIPNGVTKVTLKLSKTWNVAYIDDVSLILADEAGVDELSAESSFKAYPNVCECGEVITLRATAYIRQYRLFSLDGVLMQTDRVERQPSVNISTNALNTGYYIIEVEDIAGLRTTQKILIK